MKPSRVRGVVADEMMARRGGLAAGGSDEGQHPVMAAVQPMMSRMGRMREMVNFIACMGMLTQRMKTCTMS